MRYYFILTLILISIIAGFVGGAFIYYYQWRSNFAAIHQMYKTELIKEFKEVCLKYNCEIIYNKK